MTIHLHRLLLLLISIVLLIVVAVILLPPISSTPPIASEVAQLEAGMWRSYYANDKVNLFIQLNKLLQLEYQMSTWQAFNAAYDGTYAAFIFKRAKRESDYKKILPYLEKFYSNVNHVSGLHFDSKVAAKLELKWWIIHRSRKKDFTIKLENVLLELQSAVYQLPKEQLRSHVKYRIDAMLLRDEKARLGTLTEKDWQDIESLLTQSWQALYDQIKLNKMTQR